MSAKKLLILMNKTRTEERIERSFSHADFEVVQSDSVEDSMIMLETSPPHAMIVDLDLINGAFETFPHIVQDNCQKTILIVLTKSDDPNDRIYALEAGADDVFANPPDINTMLAKIKALVRRIDLIQSTPKSLRVKDISINLDTHEVAKKGKLLDLTYTQFKILYLLASHREYVFTRNEILKKVWGQHAYVTDRTVDVHVKRLREKLNVDDATSSYIQTIHGLGYRFA